MFSKLASLVLAVSFAALPGIGQVSTPGRDKLLSEAAKSLAALPFDSGTPVTVRGRIDTLVFPVGTSGMMVLVADGGAAKYAFSTARVPDMAKQGFSRFTMRPGEEVIVTGLLAKGGQKIGPGFTAARADLITKSDGSRVFDRSRLPGSK